MTTTESILEIIDSHGGTDAKLVQVPEAGIVGVRYRTNGLYVTRWGVSLIDLQERLERAHKVRSR